MRLVKLWASRRRVYGKRKGHLSGFAFTLLAIFHLQRTGQAPNLQRAPDGGMLQPEWVQVQFVFRGSSKGRISNSILFPTFVFYSKTLSIIFFMKRYARHFAHIHSSVRTPFCKHT